MIEFKHPEQRAGEIFFTNSDREGFELIGWSSKRKGETPYQLTDGELRPKDSRDWFPVFVKVSELQECGVSPDDIARSRYGNGAVKILYDEVD